MKLKRIAAALMLVLLAACGRAEQLLPGIDVFSPGLLRLSGMMEKAPAVHMEATLSAQDALYVRDLSLLSSMLSGTTLVYDGAQREDGWAERMRLVREGETLFEGAMAGGVIDINGEAFAAEMPDARAEALMAFVQKTPILERAPLAEVEAFLLSLKAGDELAGGYAVSAPFTSVQTMSDDGTRLTRINISGSIAKEGEAPWVIEGYLKQPAGRAPKDTFELTATKDEKNWLELSYSSTRQSEITKKNKAGKMNVDTHVKIAGEIGGYRVSERLTSFLRNTWTADGEHLDEKIVVNMTLEHQDNTPGREMQRMNKAEAKMRHDIRLSTAEAGNFVVSLTDAITLSAVMDENTVLDASANAAITVGAEAADIVTAEPAEDAQTTPEQAIARAAQEIARRIYGQLSSDAKKKALDGLQ